MLATLANLFAPLLAQATKPAPKSTTMDIMFWLMWLVVGAGALIVLGVIARKIIKGPPDERNTGIAFSISDLRRMHREGQLSDEEFERAKGAIIANSSFVMGGDQADEEESK